MKPFLQEVAEDLVTRFGDRLQDCSIVFNNKRPAAYLQKHLADIIRKPFFSPSFFTIQEFFSCSTSYKIADFYLQFFTLHKIYNQLLAEEKLEAISSYKFFPLAKIILSDFSQIDADLVDAQKLYRDLEDISVINQDFDYLSPEQYQFLSQFWTSYSEGKHKKQQELFIKMWRRMPKLYNKFHATLKEQGYLTNGSVYRHLAGDITSHREFTANFGKEKIIFVGFNALSSAEAKIFTQLQEADKALFYFDADSYYLDDVSQEAGLFLRKNLNTLGLKNEFAAAESLMKNGEHQVNVFKVQGQSAQAKILNEILEEDYANAESVGKTVIVLADESLLIPTLQTIPTAYNGAAIDLNVTMGFALATSSIFGLVDLWLTSQLEILKAEKVLYKNVESFLTHPLTGLTQKMRDKILTALLAENQVEIDHKRLLRQRGLFEVFYKKIDGPQFVVANLLEVLDFVLTRLSNAKTLKKIDAELFVKTIQELNRLQDTFGNHIGKEEIPFVIYLVQKSLQAISVPLSGDPLNGIQVMGLLETRNLNFDKVVILGFNEGIIPKSSIGNSFIPDSIRRVYGLPVLENLDAISSYMVYRLMQRARNINFVYNSLTDESTSGEASRILKQLEYESGFSFTYNELNLEVKTEQQKEVLIEKTGNAFIQQTLQRYLDKKKILSPSALTQYISNPIDFFFNYIAGIKEPKEISAVVEANEIGSILHKVMEYFYEDLRDAEITAERINARRSTVPKLIQRAFNAVMFNHPDLVMEYKGMQKVILAIVDAYVNIILNHDISQTPFTIISLEQKVEAEISFPLNGKDESVKIFGYIDRVDVKDGVTKIVDYKTGSDKLAFKDVDELFNSDGKHINKALIQTLLYTYAYEQFAGKTCVEPNLYIVKTMNDPVYGGVWFKSNRQVLRGDFLEEIKPLFLTKLKEKLAELFSAPYFKASEIPDNYKYSIYKTLFGK
ncbi:PD-(D/E)XK nuclease family protein [Pedobacter endophyticus]|uniref:PD-(D/E)XK nuclease family protein n=1 Tax=Pedobacter endophyticus TaxID=2789740 RepID=A0A7U3Q4H4_9SPHI|nr:PD-(D/E)XK nuclease family protein [Pedobacter endophyticus]QPH38427.1 PD-(D/E)XK nuclease family protein [Pedobacter endophyticus]